MLESLKEFSSNLLERFAEALPMADEKLGIGDRLGNIIESLNTLGTELEGLVGATQETAHVAQSEPAIVLSLTVFVLAAFVGYFVIWSVTPALHSPLMAVTNAISSVIIVGAVIAAGDNETFLSQAFGLVAVFLASINIFGGFIVTQRMLSMFRAKKRR